MNLRKDTRSCTIPTETTFRGTKYRLAAFIVHKEKKRKGIDEGHYVAYIKKADRWYKCDDICVTECNEYSKVIQDGLMHGYCYMFVRSDMDS